MTYSKITDEQLYDAVANSNSFMGVLRYLGLKEAGGTHSYYTNRIKKLNLDTSHFVGRKHNKGKPSCNKKSNEHFLVLRHSGTRQKGKILTRCLLELGIKHCCSLCNQTPSWMGNPLTLDVDHINENWLDDRIENLRFLCPNCHSQLSRGLCKN